MNVDFLTKYRQQPRRDFAQALYARLDQQKPGLLGGKLTFQNAALGLTLLMLVVACVRAVTAPRWEKIGNLWVYVTPHALLSPPGNFITFGVSPHATPPELPTYSLSDIVDVLGSEVKLPTWMPNGIEYDSVLSLDAYSGWATIVWTGASEDRHILMYIQPTNGPQQTISERLAPGSFREVQVNGLPAILAEGDWEAPPPEFWTQTQQEPLMVELDWDDNAGMRLFWVDGEWFYHLFADFGISEKDLVRVAESGQ